MPKSHYPASYALPFLRPTWAEIDLGAFRHNFREIKRKLRKGISLLPVVKADGYEGLQHPFSFWEVFTPYPIFLIY